MTDSLDKAPMRAPVASPGQPNPSGPPVQTETTHFGTAGFDGRTIVWPEVTEWRTAHAIRRVLDQGTGQLPDHVTDRLATARQQALARVLDTPQPIRLARAANIVPESGTSISLRWQVGALAVSVMVLAGVFLLVDSMKEEQSIEDLAEVDSALLTDDLPLDAYVDRGFSVYLVNTRLPQAQTVSFNSGR